MRTQSIFRFAEGRATYVLMAIILRLQLELGYVYFVHPLFSYAGFFLEISWVKYFESWVIYVFFITTAPKVLSRPSDYLMTFLIGGLLLPVLILYAFMDRSRECLYLFLMACALVELFRKGRPIHIPTVKGGQTLCLMMLFLLAITVTIWYVASGGVRYFNLDFSKVYEFRRDAAELTNVGILSYINGWAPKVVGPALLAFFLWKKRVFLAAGVILLHIFWFGVSAHKAVIFYPSLVFFLWFWFRNTGALSFVYMGFSAVIFIGLFAYVFFGDMTFASMFMRRVFFVVGDLVFRYYEFFSGNTFVYWSNSVLSFVFTYPYSENPAQLVGDAAGTGAYANATFIANGYMHAGGLGVAIYGVLAGLLFRIIDSVSYKGVPPWVAVAVIIVPGRSLILGADLPTSLLTHGVALAIITLMLMRAPRKNADHLREEHSEMKNEEVIQ